MTLFIPYERVLLSLAGVNIKDMAIKVPDQNLYSIVARNVPSKFVDSSPKFIAFLETFYEWLEHNGALAFNGKVLGTTQKTLTLKEALPNTKPNELVGLYVRIDNGPGSGQLRKITRWEPHNNTLTVDREWNTDVEIPYNSKYSILDVLNPGKILEYSDVDAAISSFVKYFENQYLINIPSNTLADPRLLVKHIVQFYKAKGTENSFRFLFRILYDDDIELYYPKVDLFRLNDNEWVVQKVMRISSTSNTFLWEHKKLTGAVSGSSAYVESVKKIQLGSFTVSEIELSHIVGDFHIPNFPDPYEDVFVSDHYEPDEDSLDDPADIFKVDNIYRIVTDINVTNSGSNYQVGDPVTVVGGGGYPADAIITSVESRYYMGRARNPFAEFNYEPFGGSNPGPDDVMGYPVPPYPGTLSGYFFAQDMLLNEGSQFAVTGNQIILKADEISTDGFFVGDEITLTSGTGRGQIRIVTAYDGVTKVATVNEAWTTLPNSTTSYSIYHAKGKVKRVTVTEFGVGFTSQPTVIFNSSSGDSAQGTAVLGAVGSYPGRWANTNSFLSSTKRLQDSYYWQDFSYVVKSGQGLEKYRDVVTDLLHPAGTKLFGEVSIQSIAPDTSAETTGHTLIDLGVETHEIEMDSEHEVSLTIGSFQPSFEGMEYGDLDQFKFHFDPNGFTLPYPVPNEDFWDGGQANTPVAHFFDQTIESFWSGDSTQIVLEAAVNVNNASVVSISRAPGPDFDIIDMFKLEGFEPNAPPSLPFNPGGSDTPISLFFENSIEDFIGSMTSIDIVLDSQITVYGDPGIPNVGNILRYDFTTVDTNTVPNTAPTAPSYGLPLSGSFVAMDRGTRFVSGASATVTAPSYATDHSILALFKCYDTFERSTVFTTLGTITDVGMSLEIEDGDIIYRTIYGAEKIARFNRRLVNDNIWHFVYLSFSDSTMTVKVDNAIPASTIISGYTAPSVNVTDWKFATASPKYQDFYKTKAFWKTTKFNEMAWNRSATLVTGTTPIPFSGELGGFFLYDRVLNPSEVTSMKSSLRTKYEALGITLP